MDQKLVDTVVAEFGPETDHGPWFTRFLWDLDRIHQDDVGVSSFENVVDCLLSNKYSMIHLDTDQRGRLNTFAWQVGRGQLDQVMVRMGMPTASGSKDPDA